MEYIVPTEGSPLVARAAVLTGQQVDALVETLRRLLSPLGQEEAHEQVAYCLRELIENAVRAVRKRRVFRKAGLDIADPGDYQKGLELLQEEGGGDPGEGGDGHWVEVGMEKHPEHLVLRVSNSGEMVATERRRVAQRLSVAQLYESFDEVMERVEDDSESAGLGLVMMGMILRRLGVPDGGLSFTSQEGATTFEIRLPLNRVSDEESDQLSAALLHEIDSIPQVPRHIDSLRALLSDPELDFRALARLIRRDPVLALEVLRMANSPVYRRHHHIENCEMALSLLGIRGLRGLLDTFGARKALEGRYPVRLMDRLFRHSADIAEMAAAIGRQLGHGDEVVEGAYIGGLLHDMGRIILEGRAPDTYRALQRYCEERQASEAAVESLIAGVNHARIGARMAEHWHLPDRLVQVIRYGRAPLSAPEDARGCAQLIYLAHPMAHRLRGAPKEYEVDDAVFESFGMVVPGGWEGLAERIGREVGLASAV